MNRSIIITVLSLTALSIGVPSALAERGGNGNEDGSASAAWASASPNPAAAGGSRVGLTGCGYDVKPAEIRISHSAGYTETYSVGMWNTGCFSTYFHTAEAGTYTIDLYQSQRNPRKPMLLKSSTTLTVE